MQMSEAAALLEVEGIWEANARLKGRGGACLLWRGFLTSA